MVHLTKSVLIAFGIAILLSSPVETVRAATDTLVMPRELVDFAHTNGCEQIDNFFERPGMVDPPYVYGWLPGDKEKSAALWCKSTRDSSKSYRLMFRVDDPKQLDGCPATIDWQNVPGGLSVQRRAHLLLRKFHKLSATDHVAPDIVIGAASVLVNYYDGLTDVFYCYKGNWFVSSSE